MTHPTITPTRPPTTRSAPRTLAIGTAISIGLALAVNLAIFLVGNLGSPLQVATGGEPAVADLELGAVVVATVVWLVIAAVGLAVFERVLANGFRAWAGVAAVLVAATIVPVLALDIDGGSKLALTLMHITVGAAAVVGQAVARRREIR